MFGIDIIDAGLLPAMFVALAAGMISFLSPCVLPIVPPYLAYMSGPARNMNIDMYTTYEKKLLFWACVGPMGFGPSVP